MCALGPPLRLDALGTPGMLTTYPPRLLLAGLALAVLGLDALTRRSVALP